VTIMPDNWMKLINKLILQFKCFYHKTKVVKKPLFVLRVYGTHILNFISASLLVNLNSYW